MGLDTEPHKFADWKRFRVRPVPPLTRDFARTLWSEEL